MKLVIRVIVEVILFLLVFFLGLYFNDTAYSFFNLDTIYFSLCITCFYSILRLILDISIKYYRYRKTGFYKGYNLPYSKYLIENSIYGYVLLIVILMMFFGFMRITFIFLAIIFGILYLLSVKYLNIQLSKLEVGNVNNEILLDGEVYNSFRVEYYSKESFDLLNIITSNTFGILNNYMMENPIIMFDKLCKSNYLFFSQRSMFFGDINIFCGIFNAHLERLDLKFRINCSDVLDKDTEEVQNKRKRFQDTSNNDLEVIDGILKKRGYRVISVLLCDNDGDYLGYGIVPLDVFKKLVDFKSYGK